jgi:hypothetical protein
LNGHRCGSNSAASFVVGVPRRLTIGMPAKGCFHCDGNLLSSIEFRFDFLE